VVRAKTLAVVVGVAVCTMTLAVAGTDRFISHTLVVLGFDDSEPTSAPELLRKGIEEYRWGHYDESNRAFEQASKLPGLSERELEILAQYRALMVRVNKSRQEASDLLQAALKAYEQGDLKQAESLATAVAANGYASNEIRDNAKAMLARLQSSGGSSSPGRPSSDIVARREALQLIAKARQQVRQGNFDEAESLARKAESLNVNFSRWDDTPVKVLKDISDARGSKPSSLSNQAVAANAKSKAKALVAEAQTYLRRNDYDRAQELALQAKALGANFFILETNPEDVLKAVETGRRQQATRVAKSKVPQPTNTEKPIVPSFESPPASQIVAESTSVTEEPQVTQNTGPMLVQAPETSPPADEVVHSAMPEVRHSTPVASSPTVASSAPVETPPVASAPPAVEVASAPPVQETIPESMPAEQPVAVSPPSQITETPAPSSDDQLKAEVRGMVSQARKLIEHGSLDEAEQLVAQAEKYSVKWDRYENTVESVKRELQQARAHAAVSEVKTPDAVASTDVHLPAPTSGDPRKEALEILRQGRAHLRSGNIEKAGELALLAREKNAKFRLLDDTPNQLMAEIARVRDHIKSAPVSTSESTADQVASTTTTDVTNARPAGSEKEVKKQALAQLKKGREQMSLGDYDGAIETARSVSTWSLNYSIWDDTPARVENAAKAMKGRAIARIARNGSQKDRAVADSLLAEARRELQRGDFVAAEQKARQAQELKISYGMFSDRPENVLADISRAKRAGTRFEKITPQPEVVVGGAVQSGPEMVYIGEPSVEIVHSDGMSSPRVYLPSQPTHMSSQPSHMSSVPSHSEIIVSSPTVMSSTEPPAEAVEWLTGAQRLPLTTPRRMLPGQEERIARQDGSVIPAGGDPTGATGTGPADPDRTKLEMARELFEKGNYPRAREKAMEVYSTNSRLQQPAEELLARIGVAEQGMAVQLFETGVAAARKKEYARALAFFQQVQASGVDLPPATEQQLRSYLRDLPAKVTQSGGQNSAGSLSNLQTPDQDSSAGQSVSDLGQRERAKFQQLVTETSQKVQSAKLLLSTNPSQAIKDLELAQENVKNSGLDQTMTNSLLLRVQNAIRYASQEKQKIEMDNVAKQAVEATRAERERKLAADQHKQQSVMQLVEKGNADLKQGHFSDAELAATKALEFDPDNLGAIALKYKARMESRMEANRKLSSEKEEAIMGTLAAVDKVAIPFGDDTITSIKYPDARTWTDLTKSRQRRFGEIENSIRSQKELEIERKLSEPITLSFTETPLGDVVEFLQNATGVNVFLDRHSLETENIASDRPISISLANIPLKSALKILLDQMELEYMIGNDVLMITTPLKKQGKVYNKTYFVGDLVVPIAPFSGNNLMGSGSRNNAGPIGLGAGTQNGLPGGMPMPSAMLPQFGNGLGGSPSLVPGSTGSAPNTSWGTAGTLPGNTGSGQIVDFDSLIQLIEQTISPNSWSSVGGAGTIEPFQPNLSLVVNQTQAVHDQISDLLTQLRRLQDLQVTVEVKFVSLIEDFYERIGIDFDMDIHSDAQKPLRSFGSVIAPGGAAAGGGQTPATLNLIYNDHDDDVTVGNRGPRDSNAIGPGGLASFTPDLKIPFRTGGFGLGRPSSFTAGDGLTFGLAFLSDIEVYLFLEAAQQNNRGNVLQAPKVTLFNGQFSFVFSGSIEPFVTALNPVVAAGAVAFDPVVTPFFNGAFLGVQAVISADRRYVRLTVIPQFTSISGEKRFNVSGGAGGAGGLGGGGGGGAATAQAEIVVPIISTNTVFTSVSVPDGGTIMMGGLKTKNEIRNEFGTPILNKIPYVQRLFMNTGVSAVSRSLLIMVTPRIIIQEEEEELLGKTIAF